jgi:hypothetical protein
MRTCPSCGVTRDADGFYRRSNGRTQHECKECMKARARVNNRLRMAAKRAHAQQMRQFARHFGAAT